MSRTLYLECNSGISGDMFVAAMLDLGANKDKLQHCLRSIPIAGFDIQISKVIKSGLEACDFAVILDKDYENYDHDMQYLHGHETHHHPLQSQIHKQPHSCEQPHLYEHAHSNATRGIMEIFKIIEATDITERARKLAKRIFMIIAESEAKAHGVPIEQVHFHEVGAVDSIVDIIAAAVCMDDLNFEEVIIPVLCEGYGSVRCRHGLLPIPVPAVSNILTKYHLNLKVIDVEGELVTPTGAAIAAAIITRSKLPKEFVIRKIGIGAGKREYSCVSVLRAFEIEEEMN